MSSDLFADDTNIFITGWNIDVMCQQLNYDLEKNQDWLCSNKLSFNVLKTHYMIFTPSNKAAHDVSIKICSENISRVYVTKFFGVQTDAKLNWKKKHVEYINKKLSKCTAILFKARNVFHNNCLLNLYYTFAYPYFHI